MRAFEAVSVDTAYIGGEKFFTSEKDVIASLNGTIRFEDYKTEEEIIEGCKDSEIVLCCGNPPMNENVLRNISSKLIIRNGIGVNSVDLEAATRLGKIVCNTPGYCTEELAMHTTGLILACLRNIGFYNNAVKSGEWPKGKGSSPRRLSGMTVGLFGFGSSARMIAEVFAKGFHSRVIAYDPYVDCAAVSGGMVEGVDLDTLLRESDVLSIHVHLTEETAHFFNAATFQKMKEGAILINISRGGIVAEDDLIDALKSGKLRGAGLDVLEHEPVAKDSPLLAMDQVVLTPHSAFYGEEADENSHRIVSDLIRNYCAGCMPVRYVANRGIVGKLEGFRFEN